MQNLVSNWQKSFVLALTLHRMVNLFYLFIYFIILPHTINYKQNKNDNK